MLCVAGSSDQPEGRASGRRQDSSKLSSRPRHPPGKVSGRSADRLAPDDLQRPELRVEDRQRRSEGRRNDPKERRPRIVDRRRAEVPRRSKHRDVHAAARQRLSWKSQVTNNQWFLLAFQIRVISDAGLGELVNENAQATSEVGIQIFLTMNLIWFGEHQSYF